ncbi:(Fe-S)-binding protein [Chloroflexota bacterium]
MSNTAISAQPFYQKIQLDIPDGQRIRNCLQCGNCSGICPFGYAMELPPSRMIAEVRANRFNRLLDTENIWMCVSCSACTTVCPANIPLTNGLMAFAKEELLLAGNVPTELQTALENSQRYGNPLGESPRKRSDWTKEITPEVKILGKYRQPVENLWFVGDYASYHPRVQQASIAFAKILNALGIDFGILGPEEFSDGDSQRLAGEKGLFEMLAEKNIKSFEKYQFKQIITTDPHAYNALKNEYPLLGYSSPVLHYAEFLSERIPQLEPLLTKKISKSITFHDPCYLGRVNGIYDAPRDVLKKIPGIELIEMPHHRSNSLCCGGGGGGMWMDGFHWEKSQARLSEWRISEALESKADILVIACPYEAPRFEDAAKNKDNTGKLKVLDIAELLIESMGI